MNWDHVKSLGAALAITIMWAIRSHAADPNTLCYQIAKESPRATNHAHSIFETWCYRSLPGGGVFVFNNDDTKVKGELAMRIDTAGILTHGSMVRGKVTVHSVRASDFNPMGIPLQPPRDAKPIKSAQIDEASAAEVLKLFESKRAEVLPMLSIQDGRLRGSTNLIPWRSAHWSYKSKRMFTGPNAPLVKLDRYVAARTGSNPNTAGWEAAHHSSEYWWGGHCNGWAAAAVLRAEPRFTRYDSMSGVNFRVSDQKALLVETDYCARVAFFGTRNYGRGTENVRDIDPALFHKTLLYYIGQLNKPVSIDYRPDPVVDTHVITGYTMDINPRGGGTYSVRARLRAHAYDKSISDAVGLAPSYTRTYNYTLHTNSQGDIVGGSWSSQNPDFLWVALGPASCSSRNQRLNTNYVAEILSMGSSPRSLGDFLDE